MASASAVASELEQQLVHAANKLLTPPPSTNELLDLLSELEHLLSKAEQTPSESMLEALKPAIEVVLKEEVLRHSDSDVQISVAYCFSEIMRITAPNEPFNDDQMKEFFHLTVMSIKKLSSASGSSYYRLSTILRIFSHFRLCVLLLDLELNELVVEMFQHFFNFVGSGLSGALSSDIEQIMTMIINESELFPYELLSLLVTSVKKESQSVSPHSWELGERVLRNSTAMLQNWLPEVVKCMGIDLKDYAETVASICQAKSIEDNLEATQHSLVAISSGEVAPVNGPPTQLMVDNVQVMKDESTEVKNTLRTLNHCQQVIEPKSADEDECVHALIEKSLESGYSDPTSRKRTSKPNPKYEEGYDSRLVIITPDWKKHGKRTRASSNSPSSAVLALPSEHNSETQTRKRRSASTSQIRRVPDKRHLVNQKETTVNQNSGLYLLSDTLGDFMRAQTKERHAAATSKKESEGTRDSKVKRRRRADSTKADGFCSGTKGQEESCGLKLNAKKHSGGDSHITTFSKHTDCYSDTALKLERNKNFSPLNEEGTTSSVEKHGQELVGCKIKVWWPMDETYYEGVVTFFDQSTLKHTVIYADDEVEILNLKKEDWQLVRDKEQAITVTNSSADTVFDDMTYSCSPTRKKHKGQSCDLLLTDAPSKMHVMHPPLIQADSGSQTNSSISRDKEGGNQLTLALPNESAGQSPRQLALVSLDMVNVQGYKVKFSYAPILEAIFAKHGDIAAHCTFKMASVRASLLEVVCEVVRRLQTDDHADIISEIEILEGEVAEIGATKIDVSWLQAQVEKFQKLRAARQRSSSLKDVKAKTALVSRAAKKDLEERMALLMAAQQRVNDGEKRVNVLEYVEKKINSDISDAEAEECFWQKQLKDELL